MRSSRHHARILERFGDHPTSLARCEPQLPILKSEVILMVEDVYRRTVAGESRSGFVTAASVFSNFRISNGNWDLLVT